MATKAADRLRRTRKGSTSARSATRLRAYRAKRDFTRTAEPAPGVPDAVGHRFVVQKHDARRLHFDLRLELDGVLKSWAVTRGPSLVPGEKRLAVETEDHPLEYLEWEGVIPKGEYGGGTMIVWDRGLWAATGDARKGLAKGHLDFLLEGERLKGRWHLVRMARRPQEKKDQWLLIKAKDAHARSAAAPQIVDEEMTSLLSGYSNADLARRGELRSDHAAREKKKRTLVPAAARKSPSGTRKGILPPFVEPSLAQLAETPPSGKNWVHEIKFDGYRIQARLDGSKLQLLTRRGLDWTRRFPTVAAALKKLPVSSALIDGEVVVQDERGISSFGGLQADLGSGRRDRMAFFAFDLLYCEGRDYRGAVLAQRREALREILESLPESSIVKFSDHHDHRGDEVLAQACRMGLEGIVSKRTDLPYLSGRGPHWIKSKCFLEQEFVIVGYVPSTAHRASVGSLVLGYYDDDQQLVHAGRVGTGFSAAAAAALRRELDAIAAGPPPFRDPPSREAVKGVKWVKPQLVAEVEYRGWGSEGLVRQASFKGLREDKPAEEVTLEKKPVARARAAAATATAQVRLTHPERILWPDVGVTKQGLADFYADIAKWILPHVTGRVLSAVRCPSGADKQCFYAKHAWAGLGDRVRLVDVGEGEAMIAIDDLKGLLALVQASVLEIHPWGSRIGTLDEPDRIIFDLDPGEKVAWGRVIGAAQEVRDRLAAHKLESFVKVSGGKGLHVVAPIGRGPDWDSVKDFSRRIAEGMAADTPGLYLARMTKSLRKGKVFVDYLRNGRGATAVAAYSTRARQGAPVSVPLAWEELTEAVGSSHFSIANLRQRLDFLKADPWAGFDRLRQRLPGAGTINRKAR